MSNSATLPGIFLLSLLPDAWVGLTSAGTTKTIPLRGPYRPYLCTQKRLRKTDTQASPSKQRPTKTKSDQLVPWETIRFSVYCGILAMGFLCTILSLTDSPYSYLAFLITHFCIGFWGGSAGMWAWDDEIVGWYDSPFSPHPPV